MNSRISVIIPTLNEADEIGSVLTAVRSLGDNVEIIVVDGGSFDTTVTIARESGVEVISTLPSRGGQMHAAAMRASGGILWFLHADSIPPLDSLAHINKCLIDPEVVGGNFSLRFDGTGRPAKFMTRFYPLLRKIGLMYGDSGIFVRRAAYNLVGGFKPLPLFEDVDLIRRLRKEGALVSLDAEIVTSSRRFDGRPFLPVFIRWVLFQCLYWIGVSPHWLAKTYYPVRKEKHHDVSGTAAKPS